MVEKPLALSLKQNFGSSSLAGDIIYVNCLTVLTDDESTLPLERSGERLAEHYELTFMLAYLLAGRTQYLKGAAQGNARINSVLQIAEQIRKKSISLS